MTEHHHSAIVLFYKYFLPSDYPILHSYPRYYDQRLQQFLKEICVRLGMRGRVLVAVEGINGTLSAPNSTVLRQYITAMEQFELVRDCGSPPDCAYESHYTEGSPVCLFEGIDWKESVDEHGIMEPFPDLKVSVVKEIINSGGTLLVEDIPKFGGRHLTPQQFHEALENHPDAVLIDVRNTFEYEIGHFVNPKSSQPAINPEMVTFSSFDSVFCKRNADALKDKKVLMFCTGGIRCEKASAMLKKRGVQDVSQLAGGIHRYLEAFGDEGFFQGRNFVFDQRVAVKPSECKPTNEPPKDIVVGRCVECDAPFDEICGSRLCTVCRDLVLVCPHCQDKLREYHCRRHAGWKACYFTFLEIYDAEQLLNQHNELEQLRKSLVPACSYKNVRKTLSRQIDRVVQRLDNLQSGAAVAEKDAPRRCRTCMEPNYICDGRCWGFWRREHHAIESPEKQEIIFVGDSVEPGPHWNVQRYGPKTTATGELRCGTVVELKSWGAGGHENDCVLVQWCDDVDSVPEIYRWGVVALNGQRRYDVQKVESTCSSL